MDKNSEITLRVTHYEAGPDDVFDLYFEIAELMRKKFLKGWQGPGGGKAHVEVILSKVPNPTPVARKRRVRSA